MSDGIPGDFKKNGEVSKSTLSDLLYALSENGYKNYGVQATSNGDLWQRKHESGCFFNFHVYSLRGNTAIDMATAEICFECDSSGLWCKHSLYGISVREMALRIRKIEDMLFSIFVKYDGHKYI